EARTHRRTRSVRCSGAGSGGGGGDAELGGEVGDRAGEVHVAGGHPAHVVAGEGHGHLRIGQQHIGVVIDLLGGGAEAGDEREPGREVAGGEAGDEALPVLSPAGERGLGDLVGGEDVL